MFRLFGAKSDLVRQPSPAVSASTGSVHKDMKRKRIEDDVGSSLNSIPPFGIAKRQKYSTSYYKTTSMSNGDEVSGSRYIDLHVRLLVHVRE